MADDRPRLPMIFSRDEAFRQLRDYGVVWTFRTNCRETESVWIRQSRTGPKSFDALITHTIRPVYPTVGELRPFKNLSGFASVDSWIRAIREVHRQPKKGTLHRVVREDVYDGAIDQMRVDHEEIDIHLDKLLAELKEQLRVEGDRDG